MGIGITTAGLTYGVIGLGIESNLKLQGKTSTFMKALALQKKIKSRVFSVDYRNRESHSTQIFARARQTANTTSLGELLLGGVDTKRYVGKLEKLNMLSAKETGESHVK